jgi:hypothetical protein
MSLVIDLIWLLPHVSLVCHIVGLFMPTYFPSIYFTPTHYCYNTPLPPFLLQEFNMPDSKDDYDEDQDDAVTVGDHETDLHYLQSSLGANGGGDIEALHRTVDSLFEEVSLSISPSLFISVQRSIKYRSPALQNQHSLIICCTVVTGGSAVELAYECDSRECRVVDRRREIATEHSRR